MKIVVSHEGTDFDAFASMFAVTKLFPGTQIVLWGTVNPNVRHFLSLYGTFFSHLTEKDVDWSAVTTIYVVDTVYLERLSKAGHLIKSGRVDFFIFDHHPVEESEIPPNAFLRVSGACTTILVERIQEASIPLSPIEATLLLLGIYEDTGSFTFPTTTAEDLKAASFLLSQGALVSYVPRFTRVVLTEQQEQILKDMMRSLTVEDINGVPVHFCVLSFPEYVEGVSLIVHRLMELEDIEVFFGIFAMENKVHVIARSRLSEVRLNEILGSIGGGGHQSAASATFRNRSPEEVQEEIRSLLRRSVSLTRAVDIMSHPVRTVTPETTMEEAFALLVRFGFSGLPVVDGEGKIVGLIARRDVEKAVHHGLKRAPVRSFMSTDLVAVGPEASLVEVRNLMVEKDVGRIPVVKNGRILGIITRSDVLRAMHEKENLLIRRMSRVSLTERLYLHFGPENLSLLETVAEVARRAGVRAYLVGGVVRDIILGVPNEDLDIVVEGNAIAFAHLLRQRLGGKVVPYPPFGTAILFLKDGKRIDLASARHEFYAFPGAPPQVEYANLRRDLFRRDFTVNAMAISLHPEDFGDLFDFFGGLKDLERGILRVLHPLSFVEDPARAIRAVRFEGKYGFSIEPFTMSLLKQTVRESFLTRIKPDRLKEELQLILALPDFPRYLLRMYQLDMFPSILPGCIWKKDFEKIYERLLALFSTYDTSSGDPLLLKLSPLFGSMDPRYLEDLRVRLSLSKKSVQKISLFLRERERVVQELRRESLKNSEVYSLCSSLPFEFLLLLVAEYSGSVVAERVERYLKEWRMAKPLLDGRSLQALGVPEGPICGRILQELLLAQIDGEIRTPEEGERFVRCFLERMRNGERANF
ncbi:MAG: CBS domain-containing protein [Candidatus Caldatribacterium sp.]|nr:CBS domain-containing protein [Candidatus Caldatribacterium sp.]